VPVKLPLLTILLSIYFRTQRTVLLTIRSVYIHSNCYVVYLFVNSTVCRIERRLFKIDTKVSNFHCIFNALMSEALVH